MAELKAVDEGIKGVQFLRHLMREWGLSDIDIPTPVLNDNKGAIDWILSGCKPTKKIHHENLSELCKYEAKKHNEVVIRRIINIINSLATIYPTLLFIAPSFKLFIS